LRGKDIFLCDSDTLWWRNSKDEWRSVPIPTAEESVPYVWRSNIVLSASRSIVEFNPETSEIQILASMRRNPAASALDHLDLSKPPIAVWAQSNLCTLVAGKLWSYDPSRRDWTVVFAATNCGETLNLEPTGLIYRQSGECGPRILGGLRAGSSVLEFYTCEPSQRGSKSVSGAFTPPSWIHPDGSRPHERRVSFDGPNLWIFPMASGDAPLKPEPEVIGAFNRVIRPAGKALFGSNDFPVLLLNQNTVAARELHIRLDGAAADYAEMLGKGLGEWGQQIEFVPTPLGLAILICSGGIVLWAPKQDVEAALAEINRRDPQTDRVGLAASARFDFDKNGWLDDAERRAMRQDAAWRKEEQQTIDAAMKKAVQQHGTEWDQVFAAADRDHNGQLSSFELAPATTNYPALFADRLRGVNGTLLIALRPFDLDQDLALNQQEFRTFLAEPRLIAEVNRSADWVTKFGLKVEQCDLNGDGLLDANERLTVNRLLREKSPVKTAK
jgi:hypothetical protein